MNLGFHHCNGPLTGVLKKTIHLLQLVKNAAALNKNNCYVKRAVLDTCSFQYRSSGYKILNDLKALTYITERLSDYVPVSDLRSADTDLLQTPSVKYRGTLSVTLLLNCGIQYQLLTSSELKLSFSFY